MTKKYLISVPKGKVGQVEIVKEACENYGIDFSKIAVRGIIKEFENGGWAELIRRKENEEN